jgi:hypothetical protein
MSVFGQYAPYAVSPAKTGQSIGGAPPGYLDVHRDSVAVTWHFPPPRTATPPGVRQDLRRRLAGAFLYLRPAADSAGLCLYFPALTVSAYVDVATPTYGSVTVPPMALDSHLLNLGGSRHLGQHWRLGAPRGPFGVCSLTLLGSREQCAGRLRSAGDSTRGG